MWADQETTQEIVSAPAAGVGLIVKTAWELDEEVVTVPQRMPAALLLPQVTRTD